MEKGQKIRLKQEVTPWYSGYGDNPPHTLGEGAIGIVTHTDLIPVIGRSREGNVLARFESENGSWQAELSIGQFEVICECGRVYHPKAKTCGNYCRCEERVKQ